LNQALLEIAVERHGVDVRFEHRLEDIDVECGTALIRDLRHERMLRLTARPLLATDGAGSVARRRLQTAGLIEATEADLAHGYKELTIPAAPHGGFRMARDALHIWPRGDFMLIALPNTDGTFTATLFLANRGAVSFEALSTPAAIDAFLAAHFPDVYRLMPDCVAEFQQHPTGFLGTVYAHPWSVDGKIALIGDSAHAIVPFHGQGMNCCFEDCSEFDACLDEHSGWEAVFAAFYARRKPNTDAIAAMAIENYLEMRDRVADPRFRLQQMLALELEHRHPQRFIPRYSMVMFHHEISYALAQTRGRIQTRILADLTADADTLADIDYARAEHDINLELAPIAQVNAAAG